MKNALTFLVVGLLSLNLCATQQLSKDKMNKSREVLMKARSLDHLTHLLPLAMTKEQLNKLLLVVDKARQKEDAITLNEHQELVKIEPLIDGEVKRGTKDGAVPSKEVLSQCAKLFSAFTIRRTMAAEENTTDIFNAMKSILNEGQLKVAANTLDPRAFDPNAKPDSMSQDEKIKLFIKAVILDWSSYDIMVKMASR